MMKLRHFAATAVLCVAAIPAMAAPTLTLAPSQPGLVNIGDRGAIVYYTVRPQGYEVVVTFAAATLDDGTSMRSTVLLRPGQSEQLSVGGASGTEPAMLEIARVGDIVTLTTSPGTNDRLAQR
jgi:hypothetical protein